MWAKGKRVQGGDGGIGNRHHPLNVTYMYFHSCVFLLIDVVFRLEINHVCEKQDMCV
jgi:hypothetical protein